MIAKGQNKQHKQKTCPFRITNWAYASNHTFLLLAGRWPKMTQTVQFCCWADQLSDGLLPDRADGRLSYLLFMLWHWFPMKIQFPIKNTSVQAHRVIVLKGLPVYDIYDRGDDAVSEKDSTIYFQNQSIN